MVMWGPPAVVALMMMSGHRAAQHRARMDVNHGRARVIRGSDRVGCFRDDLIRFLALDNSP